MSDFEAFFSMGTLMLFLFLTVVIIRMLNTRIWKRGKKKTTAVIGAILLSIPAIISASILNTRGTMDYTQEFEYKYSVARQENTKRAKILHNMMGSVGIRDPIGFLFLTPPDVDEVTYKISLERGEPYYLVRMGDISYETLLQVPTTWLDDLHEIEMKVWDFLDVPPEIISRISVTASTYKTLVTGNVVKVVINVKDSTSEGMVVIILFYALSSGFATTKVIYTTTGYNREEALEVYAEVGYEEGFQVYKRIMTTFLLIFPMTSIMWLITFMIPRIASLNSLYNIVFGDSLDRGKEVIEYSEAVWRMN